MRGCKKSLQGSRKNKKESVNNENAIIETKSTLEGTNSRINEIKSTLEGTNSRMMEAEDRISEVEDRKVEINEEERKKGKRI